MRTPLRGLARVLAVAATAAAIALIYLFVITRGHAL
jgi:LPS O-antigen subunit length determinant protein (WzzB/FepE family)